jgi:hypothetical protein
LVAGCADEEVFSFLRFSIDLWTFILKFEFLQ